MRTHRLLCAGLAAGSLVLACDGSAPVQPGEAALTEFSAGYVPVEDGDAIAQLRRLIAPLHRFERAMDAGWSDQFTPCLEVPGLGGMGFHYSNPAYLNDGGAVDLLEPELLLFEPQKNGRMRLVGVEYVVLFTDRAPTEDPPTLLGQEFLPVPDAGLWGLHIWVGRQNPSGIYADWNPKVTCEYAPSPAAAAAAGHRHGR